MGACGQKSVAAVEPHENIVPPPPLVKLCEGRCKTPIQQEAFADKPQQGRGGNIPRVGYICRKGTHDLPNQDNFVIAEAGDFVIYGVFDGHGAQGHVASISAADNLVKQVARHPALRRGHVEAAVKAAFEEHLKESGGKSGTSKHSGSTATLLVKPKSMGNASKWEPMSICVAQVGNSNAVLGTSQQGEEVNAVPLAAGGNASLKNPGTDACIESKEIGPNDQFVVLGSEGIWGAVSPQEAVEIVGSRLPVQAQMAAWDLAQTARERWQQEKGAVEQAPVGDMTAICIWLR